MRFINKIIALAMLTTVLNSSGNNVEGVEYCSYIGGCGYEECCAAPCLTPAIALATVTLAGIIVLALQKSHGRVEHDHSHD